MPEQPSGSGPIVDIVNDLNDRAMDFAQIGLALYLAAQHREANRLNDEQLDTQEELLDLAKDKATQIPATQTPAGESQTPVLAGELGPGPTPNTPMAPEQRRLFELAIAPDGTHVAVGTQAGLIDGLIIDGGVKDGTVNVAVAPENADGRHLSQYEIRTYDAEAVVVLDTHGFPPRHLEPGSEEHESLRSLGADAMAEYEARLAAETASLSEAKKWWQHASEAEPLSINTGDLARDAATNYDHVESTQDKADAMGDQYSNPLQAGSPPRQGSTTQSLSSGAFTETRVSPVHTSEWASKAEGVRRGRQINRNDKRNDRLNQTRTSKAAQLGRQRAKDLQR